MDLVISGAKIYFYILGFPITETMVNMWMVILAVLFLCLWITKDLKTSSISKKQAAAEILVDTAYSFVVGNMGERYRSFSSFIAALFTMSVLCSLMSVFGFYSPTSDLSVTLSWALAVFVMITYTKIKTNKFSGYLKGFAQPIVVLTPFNIIGEIATPLSMAFRHFGNITSGGVIMALLHAALIAGSSRLFGSLPAPLSGIPFLDIGIPAVLSIYFDIFSSFLQAYIFCMLTTMYIYSASETE